jgi:phosphoglycolate phosphatase-like HAD superfamily hydrolase
MKHYKALVFDFDGTLIISNQLKIDAYYDIFRRGDVDHSIIESTLKMHPELNRYDTISKILENANCEYNLASLSDIYSELVFERVIKARNLDHAEELLEHLTSKDIKLFLSSNTPAIVLKEIINHKGWNKYFDRIYGFPNKKTDTIKQIIEEFKFETTDCLIIGDGESDRLSALSNNIDFCRISTNSLFPLVNYLEINLSELNTYSN